MTTRNFRVHNGISVGDIVISVPGNIYVPALLYSEVEILL